MPGSPAGPSTAACRWSSQIAESERAQLAGGARRASTASRLLLHRPGAAGITAAIRGPAKLPTGLRMHESTRPLRPLSRCGMRPLDASMRS